MPIYDYQCPECDTQLLDQLRGPQAKPPKCPKCEASMKKLWQGAPNFRLYGDGYYKPNKR